MNPDSQRDLNQKLSRVTPERRKHATLTQQPVIVQEHNHYNGFLHLGIFILTVIPWMMGIVLAVGDMKWLSIFFPPYAWYLTTECLMKLAHLIP